jgi:hypothetical protein
MSLTLDYLHCFCLNQCAWRSAHFDCDSFTETDILLAVALCLCKGLYWLSLRDALTYKYFVWFSFFLRRRRIQMKIAPSVQQLATDWTAKVQVKARFFLLSMLSRPTLGPNQPSIQRVPEALSLAIKRPGRKADHSRPAGAEVKNTWICTTTPPHIFVAYCRLMSSALVFLKLSATERTAQPS